MTNSNQLTITSYNSVAALKEQWLALEKTTQNKSLFLSYAWHDAASQWQPDSKGVTVLVANNPQGETVGICPLALKSGQANGLQFQTLEFIQVPDVQQSNILASAENYADVATAITQYLNQRSDWDILKLSHLPKESADQKFLGQTLQVSGLRYRWSTQSGNPYINLGQNWADFYSSRSRRLKKGNNLAANRLKKAHDSITIDWLYGADVSDEQWSTALQAAKIISGNCWKNSTGLTLDHAGPAAFIDCLSNHAIANNTLSLWLVKLDDKPVAMEYQIIYQGYVHALRADYDEAFSELSPGSYLNWKLLEQLFEQPLQQYQMGPGDNPYKQRWAEGELELRTLTIYNNTLKGKILFWLNERIKPFAKTVIKPLQKSKK